MLTITASGTKGEITMVLPLDEIPDIQPGNFDIVRAAEQRLATIYEVVFGDATLATVKTEPQDRKVIVAAVDTKAWDSLLEAWGDGTNDWDRSDIEPVYKGAIHPISKALDPSYNDSPPYGDTWLEDEEGVDER